MSKLKTLMFSLLFLLLSSTVVAQSDSDSKEDIVAKATQLFNDNLFEEALPLYQQLYNQTSADGIIAFRYGVCLLETKSNLDEAASVLLEATKKKQTEAYLYLGDAYTDLFRFAEANEAYDEYLKLKSRPRKKDEQAEATVEEKKEELNSLRKLVRRTENIQIIDSVIVDKSNLLSPYKLNPVNGKLAYFDQVFKANVKVNSTVYFNEKGSKIYFGQPEGSTYSLFTMDKLLDGFGNEQKMVANNFDFSGSVNYVYVMQDGVTIYFAAEDVAGMGGYDLYVTRYNMNTNSYLTPERLNMPFNSAYNDYLYVVDEEKGIGWFATDRFMPEDKVCVYTFIPNREVEIIESEDEPYLSSRARIVSIKDSWRQGSDYSKLIALARTEVMNEKDNKPDFSFVINDAHTYHFLKDFKSQAAKNIFSKIQEKQNELKNVENSLQSNRDNYTKASTSDKARLSSEILRLEQRQESLYSEIEQLEKQVKREEIKAL